MRNILTRLGWMMLIIAIAPFMAMAVLVFALIEAFDAEVSDDQ